MPANSRWDLIQRLKTLIFCNIWFRTSNLAEFFPFIQWFNSFWPPWQPDLQCFAVSFFIFYIKLKGFQRTGVHGKCHCIGCLRSPKLYCAITRKQSSASPSAILLAWGTVIWFRLLGNISSTTSLFLASLLSYFKRYRAFHNLIYITGIYYEI